MNSLTLLAAETAEVTKNEVLPAAGTFLELAWLIPVLPLLSLIHI